jgi:hypothetical protein
MMLHQDWIGSFVQGLIMGAGMAVAMMVAAGLRVMATRMVNVRMSRHCERASGARSNLAARPGSPGHSSGDGSDAGLQGCFAPFGCSQ